MSQYSRNDNLPDTESSLLAGRDRGDWVRLRTFITLRWIAIIGQLSALIVAWLAFGIKLDVGLCALAVGASVLANLVAMFVYPASTRLSEKEAMLSQLFDIAQIAFLLYLTGGISNPFAALVIVPVTISATALESRSTLILGGVAATLVTLLWFYNIPLQFPDGPLELPKLYLIGYWVAILTAMVFLASYARRISEETHSMARALAATQMALAREQKLTDLGGVVAAAAHELGTPLATIKMVSSELKEDLAANPELLEDVTLISQEADRCKEILRSMGQVGKDDLFMKFAPLEALIREAAEPHISRGKVIHFDFVSDGGNELRQPVVHRQPEAIHGIRNLVQNAVDFAQTKVWVTARWNERTITLRITDDGPGFPQNLVGRIAEPFVRERKPREDGFSRPEYEGMGLGLFIAKTLLERTGADLTFANASDPFLTPEERPEKCGAVVEVVWPFDRFAVDENTARKNLGENPPIQT